ncbi:hypothetical protein [Nioella sp.]|uniref:hypothetical protein n=1 Tax=Nioella sp. TaxID=1912091 RepID=UPI003512E23D
MALSFPLPWSEFGALLPVQSAPWTLKRFEQVTWSGSSVPNVAELSDPRWRCRVTLDVMDADEASELRTLFELHGSGHPLLLHDPARPGPRLDRDGSLLGAAAPTLATVSATGFSLKGLPPAYALSRGDLVSVVHGTAARRALYVLAEGASANGSGVTPQIRVLPAPRLIAAADHTVDLINPTGLMLVLPDSYEPGQSSGTVVRGMGFDAVEAW